MFILCFCTYIICGWRLRPSTISNRGHADNPHRKGPCSVATSVGCIGRNASKTSILTRTEAPFNQLAKHFEIQYCGLQNVQRFYYQYINI